MPKSKVKSKQISKNTKLMQYIKNHRTIFIVVPFAIIGVAFLAFSRAATLRPDASNTGWQPTGVTLKNQTGDITITTNGTVIDGINLNGCIIVKANNVTIKRSKITSDCFNAIEIRDWEGPKGLVVEDVEIDGRSTSDNCIAFGNYIARRVNLHNCADGAKFGDNTMIESSYIHNLSNNNGCHCDGLQTTGGTNIIIRNNTIDDPQAGAAIMFGDEDGRLANILVDGNYMYAATQGSIIFYGGYNQTTLTQPTNMTVSNNRFGPYSRQYAYIAPSTKFFGNVDDVKGTKIGSDQAGSGIAPVVVQSTNPNAGGSTSPNPTPAPSPTTPPAAPVTAVSLKGIVEGSTVQGDIRVEAITANETNFQQIDFYLDGKFNNAEKTAPFCYGGDDGTCFAFDTKKLTNGKHTIKADLKYGTNQTVSSIVNFTVNNPISTPTPAPTPTPTPAPAPQPVVDKTPPSSPSGLSASLSFDFGAGGYVNKLNWAPSTDNTGVVRYVIARNAQSYGSSNLTNYTDRSVSANTRYTYTVAAQDAAGNVSTPATVSISGSCFLFWCSYK